MTLLEQIWSAFQPRKAQCHRYTFSCGTQYGHIRVVYVYRDDKLIKEYNCGDRMKLGFIRNLMTRTMGKEAADSVLIYGNGVCLYTSEVLFK